MDTTQASGQAPVTTAPGKGNRWFVMRDLSRSNAKVPAWEMLRDKHIRHFTPLVWRMMSVGGKRKPRQVPYIQDLVFAYGISWSVSAPSSTATCATRGASR